ncbi:MAG: polysaccharide biosynthesis protein [Pseudonocardiaceae bacterium]|nr:polysaccharide biosynthesis protein [Pseudonocardiaceae bacterium]
MTTTSPSSTPEPLLDLPRLVSGIRWRRRFWVSLGLLGLLVGAVLAVLAPPPPTAVARLLIVHEEESSDSGQMDTDVALLETTRIAAAALQRINAAERPEDFLKSYEGEGLTGNVLELTVSGSSDRDAVVRARALAEAFIADHLQRTEDTANAEARALLDRRARVEAELAGVDDVRRAELTAQLQELGQRAEEARTSSPRVAAGTQIADGPRAVTESPLMTGVMNIAVGVVLGLGAGLGLAAVASVVQDRPVLRRDIAAHLGASVIAQLPAPRRGPTRLWRRSRGVAERQRIAATLARIIRDDPGTVSLLELGCPRTAAALALDIAQDLAGDRPVVVVDDLPGQYLRKLSGQPERPFPIVDATGYDRPSPVPQERHIGVGSVGPGTAWTDLGRLGSGTLLVVRTGHAGTLWLHTVARQLADARIPVIGVVLVHPDPRDRSDGTLWDGLHTALRGRTAGVTAVHTAPASEEVPSRDERQVVGTPLATNTAAVVAPRAPGVPRAPRGAAVTLAVPGRRFDRGGAGGTSGTGEPPTGETPAVESSKPESVEVS